VASGLAIVSVTAIGNDTRLAKIGKSLENIKEEKTPLELQINDFVKKMVIAGAIVFVLVWLINYLRIGILTDSLIKALTLAMSILPEEIPVAFTTFMALGAYRLMKMGIVVKQMKTLETLGSATVICTDKTGTITENEMSLTKVYVLANDTIANTTEVTNEQTNALVRVAMWASEPIPFDPMEVALHGAYAQDRKDDERPNYHLVHEYPLEGKPPMMTHVFEQKDGTRIVAAKGAPEALIAVSGLSEDEKKKVEAAITNLTTDGYRVLGVGQTVFEGDNYPEKQQDFKFEFLGLVAFSDPPKKNITEVLKSFYNAGIVVKIITGDNAATTNAIAKQVGFRSDGEELDGAALLKMSDEEVREKVVTTNIFTRMFPEAKIKIIEALKGNKQIVAMTGDGVNDAPALKAAHIGIAMGKRGTEIAKGAASLVLMEDDLSKIVDAVAMGRRIYTNLKKAIRYIISIHIPIILIVFIPLALGWAFPNIFSPIHVIFFELVMGPTCSIIFENEPMEPNAMRQKPRPFTLAFFNARELGTSIIQGLVITIGALAVYQYAVRSGLNESHTRAMVFVVVIASNISLTLVNRSFIDSILHTIRYKNNLVLLVIGITIAITAAMLYVPPVCRFFQFEPLGWAHLGISASVGLVCVLWYEIVKFVKRRRSE
jgi:Ca2+-transporting ATPase